MVAFALWRQSWVVAQEMVQKYLPSGFFPRSADWALSCMTKLKPKHSGDTLCSIYWAANSFSVPCSLSHMNHSSFPHHIVYSVPSQSLLEFFLLTPSSPGTLKHSPSYGCLPCSFYLNSVSHSSSTTQDSFKWLPVGSFLGIELCFSAENGSFQLSCMPSPELNQPKMHSRCSESTCLIDIKDMKWPSCI